MKRILRFLLILLVILFVAGACLLKRNDFTPLEQTQYYPATMKALSALQPNKGYGKLLKCGWAAENITPDFDVHVAGYGVRWKSFSGIHDSIFVRTLVFDNGLQKAALVSLDMMIVPPLVVDQVMPQLEKMGFSRAQVYFGATHTHSSAGGWAKGLGGWALAGPFNEDMIDKVANGIIAGVQKAQASSSNCTIGFEAINAADLVENRLFGSSFPEDPYLRVIKIVKDNHESAMMLSYSAHATCIPKRDNLISCDYPGMLVQKLERGGSCNFATFFAGAVGSMRPIKDTLKGVQRAEALAAKLQQRLNQHDSIKTDTTSFISTAYLPLQLHDPQLRVNDEYRLRPWVFNALLGKQQIGMNRLQIGNIVFIGTPCDYSGEMVELSQEISNKKQRNLLITSFNGGYIGYITPDKYYDSVKAETREMNWYGPNNGRYFSELVNGLILK
ncbi:neutral/alkaline non-lysosomal ceramidase N-terminal domain-containing protein [Solitalea sp. MAHUQ-68]|uniref:Neutral/alkaline non-lysosomal ceramidase N-terminal domain-containing protein n=1 Tax=Solitalea agri TaxID=2953739 RepID=A0A9X2F5R2_9SPHI|nr:neutral/alkaline non-lysosomal ceramidase N-terminal domain-containing protein [Solitalea agri]MCO4292861.1 neutral/alkaline non-lysosomal ceramidase N-terminal domain-containing protein [Solitalea agri]